MDQIHHEQLQGLCVKILDMGREEFLRSFTTPFLIVGFDKDDKGSSVYQTKSAGLHQDGSTTDTGRVRILKGTNEFVSNLAKSGRNNFPDRIMIGRAITNDILLNHPSVSKFHAFFRLDPGSGRYHIVDVGSSNGTAVGGSVLKPEEQFPLASGDPIMFAESIRAVFLNAEDFYAYAETGFQDEDA